jgi:hypothetical protein
MVLGVAHTPKGKLRRGVSASLVVSDETQDLAEAGHGQETTVLRVCDLPYLTQDRGRELGALEELDGNLACDYAELLRVGLLEEVLEDALLFGCEVEDGLVCAWLAHMSTAGSRGGNPLNSPLAARSAMAEQRAMPGRVVVVMGDAGNEAEAPSCRAIARGSCVFPAGGRAGESREAGGGKRGCGGLTRATTTMTTTTTTTTDDKQPQAPGGGWE